MTDTKRVKTGDIEVGDVVREHGMRVRIDLITAYESDGINRYEYPTVWSCVGTVINAAEVIERDPGMAGYLHCWGAAEAVKPDARAAHQAHKSGECWTVQGNDLARWLVEADAEVTA